MAPGSLARNGFDGDFSACGRSLDMTQVDMAIESNRSLPGRAVSRLPGSSNRFGVRAVPYGGVGWSAAPSSSGSRMASMMWSNASS